MTKEQALNIPTRTSLFPQNEATIHPDSCPFLKFQTIQQTESQPPSIISEQAYSKGDAPSRYHEMCLQCMGPIDIETCRSVDEGWAIGWYCPSCGYLKQSKEQVVIFLMGAYANTLDPSEIDKYKDRIFPWIESQSPEDDPTFKIPQFYQQVACFAQQEEISLRETLGDADFFGYPGIFDLLSRGWCETGDWIFSAVRIQGIIWINHEISNRKRVKGDTSEHKRTTIPASTKQEERKVKHYQLIRSELSASSGKSASICVLAEFTLNHDGEPIKQTKAGWIRLEHRFGKDLLGRLITMALSGVLMISHPFNGENEECSLDELRDMVGSDLEQRSWNFLAETLSLIRENLPDDGEYCTIKLGRNTHGYRDSSRSLTIENKGNIDPECFRNDFREAFRI